MGKTIIPPYPQPDRTVVFSYRITGTPVALFLSVDELAKDWAQFDITLRFVPAPFSSRSITYSNLGTVGIKNSSSSSNNNKPIPALLQLLHINDTVDMDTH
ncbi:hypothetical protein ElyMa_002432800 [Elysia marginata]|uniref:Uncharacterized protein n=1 Tax=Elysia marginata TaxID=1093978 RepID=A0AAV4GK21_9GAST|nr:hypothetical protein ElyMa_002432800 [Elysia marginata]